MFGKKSDKAKEIRLEDVVPLHPNDYPAKHLKEKLDHRREQISEAGHCCAHEPGMAGLGGG
jgi:hypothetical protein